MPQKILFRTIIIFTIVIILFLFLHSFLQWETVLNEEVSFSLPAAVYISPNQDLQFSYADLFFVHVQYLEGGELQYHVDLLTDRADVHGYVEVWNSDTSLSVFLEKAKGNFSKTVKNFQETFPDDSPDTRIWEYEIADGIHVKQYFSQKEGKLLVVSLFVPISLWSKKYNAMFEEIQTSVTFQ